MSWNTSTCPSHSGPAPIPMVGALISAVIMAATSRGMPSRKARHPGAVQGHSIAHELFNAAQALSLHLVAAHHIHRLRGQADVPSHWNLGVNNLADQVGALFPALDFHHLGAALLHKASRVADGGFGVNLV